MRHAGLQETGWKKKLERLRRTHHYSSVGNRVCLSNDTAVEEVSSVVTAVNLYKDIQQLSCGEHKQVSSFNCRSYKVTDGTG